MDQKSELMAWVFEINGTSPTPLVLAAKLPSASLETGLARQPAEAKARLFLPTSTRLQLAFVETERLAAEQHVKSKMALEKGLEMGMKPLSKMPKGELVALLKEYSLDSNGRKDALVQRLMECAASGDEASDGSLAHLAQLDVHSRGSQVGNSRACRRVVALPGSFSHVS